MMLGAAASDPGPTENQRAERIVDFMTVPQPGTFASSDLIGQNAHGADREEIAAVTEVLVDPEG